MNDHSSGVRMAETSRRGQRLLPAAPTASKHVQLPSSSAHVHAKPNEQIAGLKSQLAESEMQVALLAAKLQTSQATVARASSTAEMLKASLTVVQEDRAAMRLLLDAAQGETSRQLAAVQVRSRTCTAPFLARQAIAGKPWQHWPGQTGASVYAVQLESDTVRLSHTQAHRATNARAEAVAALASLAQVSHQAAMRAQHEEAEERASAHRAQARAHKAEAQAAAALASATQVSLALALREVEAQQVRGDLLRLTCPRPIPYVTGVATSTFCPASLVVRGYNPRLSRSSLRLPSLPIRTSLIPSSLCACICIACPIPPRPHTHIPHPSSILHAPRPAPSLLLPLLARAHTAPTPPFFPHPIRSPSAPPSSSASAPRPPSPAAPPPLSA
jgi:hypothetical protein